MTQGVLVPEAHGIAPETAQLSRFETLDGMRGLAAVAVLLLHLNWLVYRTWYPHHAFMAVDLFFGLSGFVLAHSYDKRMEDGLTVRKFMLLRARRLFPLYYVGLFISILSIPLSRLHGTLQWCITIVSSLFLLPGAFPGDTFPLNGPSWSLCFEFWVANLFYALFGRQLRGWRLSVFLAITFALLAVSVFQAGSIGIGWDYGTILYGIPRTLFSFFAGVFAARYYKSNKPKFRVPPAVILLAVLAVLCEDWAVGVEAFELLSVLLIFPVLLYFGAGADRRHSPFLEWMGDASYAVYAIHVPIVLDLLAFSRFHQFPRGSRVAGFALAILFMILASLLHRFYDLPVRRWIARKWPIETRRESNQGHRELIVSPTMGQGVQETP